MSASLYRLRKDLKRVLLDETLSGPDLRLFRAGIAQAMSMVDDELERIAEGDFLKPITPSDPIGAVAPLGTTNPERFVPPIKAVGKPVGVPARHAVDLNPPVVTSG